MNVDENNLCIINKSECVFVRVGVKHSDKEYIFCLIQSTFECMDANGLLRHYWRGT